MGEIVAIIFVHMTCLGCWAYATSKDTCGCIECQLDNSKYQVGVIAVLLTMLLIGYWLEFIGAI